MNGLDFYKNRPQKKLMDAVLAPTIAFLNKKNKDSEVIGGNYAFHDKSLSGTS